MDFQMPTQGHKTGMPTDQRRTGTMMLYTLDELFYMFRGIGTNDIDGQRVVTYEILTGVAHQPQEALQHPW